MLEMTTNLLDINAIEQGKVHFDVHRLNCHQLVRGVVQMNVNRAEHKKISLVYHVSEASVYALADENALTQVVDNIVSNAIKYSPPETRIDIRLGEKPCSSIDSMRFVRIEVQDQGPGLSDEDKQRLFGKFARLSAMPTGGEHSTGLGLSIVKRMVEQMNGRVFCESTFGQGATFIVELPIG
jgi:signal transduction histidine kinase